MEKKLLRKVVLRMLKRQSREVRASLRVWAARVVLTVAAAAFRKTTISSTITLSEVELGSTRQTRNVEKSGITYQVGGDSQNNQVFEVRVEVM